jgi:hypothetical protein
LAAADLRFRTAGFLIGFELVMIDAQQDRHTRREKTKHFLSLFSLRMNWLRCCLPGAYMQCQSKHDRLLIITRIWFDVSVDHKVRDQSLSYTMIPRGLDLEEKPNIVMHADDATEQHSIQLLDKCFLRPTAHQLRDSPRQHIVILYTHAHQLSEDLLSL